MHLYQWAAKWGVSLAAIQDLQRQTGEMDVQRHEVLASDNYDETAVSNLIRVRASEQGWPLWRNNKGVLDDKRGVPVRFGLANDSHNVGKRIRSGDLIGCRPIVITQEMVGMRFGQFVSVEAKKPTWTYKGDEHELAQLAWVNRVNSLGGWAIFANTPEAIGPAP